MKNEIVPVVRAVAEFMPPKKNGFFEKSMEVARLLLEHEPISVIGHTVDSAIQTFGMIKETKYRAKALKYTTHLEEARLNAEVEIARIQTAGAAIQLYIDRSFQRSLDRVEQLYINQSYAIEQSRKNMIQELNNAVQTHFDGIDTRYINTIRENEMKCAMYRDFLNQSNKEGIQQAEITMFIAKKLAENMDRYNSRAVISVCDVLNEMIRQNPTVSFGEYLNFEKHLKKFR